MNTEEFQKKILKGYSKVHELKLITIGLASPEKIQSWAEKELPNGKIFGEVTNPNTFHYKTFKPSKGGLFCERIFGPIKDFECACGKRQKPNFQESQKILQHQYTTRHFCPVCDVEYTWSIIRRYQLGYIKLHTPVTHLWYFKSNPSYLSILFDMKKKDLESIIYCTNGITLENIWKINAQEATFSRSPTDLYRTWKKFLNFEEKMKKYQWIHKTDRDFQKRQKESFRTQIDPSQWDGIKKNQTWFFSESLVQNLDTNKLHVVSFPKFEMLKSLRSFPSQNNLFVTNKKFFFLLQRQKNKKNFADIFENLFKKYVKQSFENATAILFSKRFATFTIQATFFDIFLFTREKTRFEKDFFSPTRASSFKKAIFWIFLCQQFQNQKEKKVMKLKKLSKKQLLFLITLIPIFQKIEVGFQQKILKIVLLKFLSSLPISLFFPLSLKVSFVRFEKKRIRKTSKQKKREKLSNFFFEKNLVKELKASNEILLELQNRKVLPFSYFFFNFEEIVQFLSFFQKIQYFQNSQFQHLDFFESVLTQYFFSFFFKKCFKKIQKILFFLT